MKYENGDCYDGDWFNGLKQGKGLFTTSDGKIFDGHWHNDIKEGEGRAHSPDGSTYEGVWSNGKLISFKMLASDSYCQGHLDDFKLLPTGSKYSG